MPRSLVSGGGTEAPCAFRTKGVPVVPSDAEVLRFDVEVGIGVDPGAAHGEPGSGIRVRPGSPLCEKHSWVFMGHWM